MGPEIIFALLSGLLTLAGGRLVINDIAESALRKFFKQRGWLKPQPELPYSDKLNGLTTSLLSASKEMDALLAELAETAKVRKDAVDRVEQELAGLENRERELKERIDKLQNVPIPAVEEFARLTQHGERRSAKRDYLLFGAGVVVSTVIAIILKLVGLG